MIRKFTGFIARHYLVFSYAVLALAFILFILFNQNLKFLIQMISALVVILLFAIFGAMAYIFIKAIVIDKRFDKTTLRNMLITVAGIAVLYPVLVYGIGVDTFTLNKIYLLAPLASWPAIFAVLLLNIYNKFGQRRHRK